MEKLDSLFPFILYVLDGSFFQVKKNQFSKMDVFPHCEDSQFSLLENFFGPGYFLT